MEVNILHKLFLTYNKYKKKNRIIIGIYILNV